MSTCFHCGTEITDIKDRRMLGLDIPYVNLFFHRECFALNVAEDSNAYIRKNEEKVYNYLKKYTKKGKNQKSWQ